MELPLHLQKYQVEQDYSRYTPIDQAAWRHIMRQLKSFLSVHAHPVYVEGLRKTGIDVETIPSIEKMSERLQEFGWRAIPVSGFIPPAAFMELQSLGILPIASDMRSVDHMLYTPAPDIVHEAAGHAPILVDSAFASYLKAYAQVARRAIISKRDMDQYEAIRILSDVKEDPTSSPVEIAAAEERLKVVTAAIDHISEAALLGRMNWWTAEYGLIGDLQNPKIFGAGLLSSIGESRACLNPKVKKIPLSIDCLQYSYDITEQQPQLFVVSEFSHLLDVLEELAKTMAYRTGGVSALEKARVSETVNTVELDSGLQMAGVLKSYGTDGAYLNFEGPTQLALDSYEIHGQGVARHSHGFGSPIGTLPPETLKQIESAPVGSKLKIEFASGVKVEGTFASLTRNRAGTPVLVTFSTAKATRGSVLLFDPAWGEYDMAIGSTVRSVFGGPADRSAYGEVVDFAKRLVPRRKFSASEVEQHELYRAVRNSRMGPALSLDELKSLYSRSQTTDWLIRCEILELAEKSNAHELSDTIRGDLEILRKKGGPVALHIDDSLRTLHDS